LSEEEIPASIKETRNAAGAVRPRRTRSRKAAEFLEDGHPEVIFKDLLGNIKEHAAVVALAESVGQGS
jgi:hypothetical protein